MRSSTWKLKQNNSTVIDCINWLYKNHIVCLEAIFSPLTPREFLDYTITLYSQTASDCCLIHYYLLYNPIQVHVSISHIGVSYLILKIYLVSQSSEYINMFTCYIFQSNSNYSRWYQTKLKINGYRTSPENYMFNTYY